jgi:hypothetical protein
MGFPSPASSVSIFQWGLSPFFWVICFAVSEPVDGKPTGMILARSSSAGPARWIETTDGLWLCSLPTCTSPHLLFVDDRAGLPDPGVQV